MHGFWQKFDLLLVCLFWAKKARKKHILIFCIVKNAFLTWKVKLYQSQKNRHFAKGLVHGFFKKIDLFLICFVFSRKSQKETFFDILDRKECFLDLKSEVLKNSKKWTVCKGVSPWFFQKIDLFLICFFFSKKSQKETFF